MKTIGIATLVVAVAVGGCTVKNTTVKEADVPPTVVYQQPAPTVVYQAPPTVVHQPLTQAPTRSVSITYNGGMNGFELATQRANAWCADNYGNAAARLIADDRNAGRATYVCVAL
jgi:hypothetical protein